MAKFTFEQNVYTYDIDSSHHVSNITYIKWMEIGRNLLSEQAGLPLHQPEHLGFAPVLRKTEITYKKPLYLGDKVKIEVYFSSLRKIAGIMEFRFYNKEKLLVAEGSQEALFFSLKTKMPHKLSREHREMFAQFLYEGE